VTYGGYQVENDPYVYRNTDCLKNRLGIRDPTELSAFELEMSVLRAEESFPAGRFTPSHYRAVHWHMFRDVYAWAGRYRTVRTGKGGNWFCYPEYIGAQMKALFARLRGPTFRPGVEAVDFLDHASDFLSELNAIHAFREGNGRSQLAFMDLLAQRAGHPMDFSRVRQVTFLPAMIASFGGDLAPLRAEFAALRI